jgi:cell division protein FtsB
LIDLIKQLKMAKKLRLTNFARFFIFLVIIIPAAFFGASYINGEDPKENLDKLLNRTLKSNTDEVEPSILDVEEEASIETDEEETSTIKKVDENDWSELQAELEFYKSKVKKLESQIATLEKENYILKQNR